MESLDGFSSGGRLGKVRLLVVFFFHWRGRDGKMERTWDGRSFLTRLLSEVATGSSVRAHGDDFYGWMLELGGPWPFTLGSHR